MNRSSTQIVLARRALHIVAASLLLVAPVQFSRGDDTDDEKPNAAKNIARMNCGAQIESITPAGRIAPAGSGASALITDDSTLSCPLEEGETTFIISFPKTSLLDRFTFVNENAAAQGELRIAVSNYQLPAISSRWTPVSGSVAFTRKRLFNLSLVGVEARYVKLSFHVEKGGRIASLGLYGTESLQRFANRRSDATRVSNMVAAKRLEDVVNFNFANIYASARVVFVSSGASPTAHRMIDDDTTTGFTFATSDRRPTAIIELAGIERLHRVSTLYKMQAGRLDVYVMNNLGTDPADLSGAKLIASVVDSDGSGKAAVDFDARGARYVAFRWTPAEVNRTEGFQVAEVNAFGDAPLSILTTSEAPELYATNEALPPITGETSTDFSNKLGTLADPPVLAQVSP
jgi:hypothetical protein